MALALASPQHVNNLDLTQGNSHNKYNPISLPIQEESAFQQLNSSENKMKDNFSSKPGLILAQGITPRDSQAQDITQNLMRNFNDTYNIEEQKQEDSINQSLNKNHIQMQDFQPSSLLDPNHLQNRNNLLNISEMNDQTN